MSFSEWDERCMTLALEEVYLEAKLMKTTQKFYYFDWNVLNQNKEALLFCKVKFLRYSQQS